MRKLLLSLCAGCFFACLDIVCGVDWGDSGLKPGGVYVAWELSTDFGVGGAKTYAYLAFANENYSNGGYPPDTGSPDGKYNDLSLLNLKDNKRYVTIANKVNAYLDSFETDWLMYFNTQSGNPATVTFRCLVNNLPDNTNVSVRLLTVDDESFEITALTEGATCEVTLPPSTSPNSILAFYEIPQATGVEYALSLSPGWNLVGNPFLEVMDVGALFDYPVMRCGAPAPTRVTAMAGLVSGASYWVFNPGSETQTVTLTGTARIGTETSFQNLTNGWNFASPVGCYNKNTGGFDAATEVRSVQWRWEAPGRLFEAVSTPPEVGVGYMVKEGADSVDAGN